MFGGCKEPGIIRLFPPGGYLELPFDAFSIILDTHELAIESDCPGDPVRSIKLDLYQVLPDDDPVRKLPLDVSCLGEEVEKSLPDVLFPVTGSRVSKIVRQDFDAASGEAIVESLGHIKELVLDDRLVGSEVSTQHDSHQGQRRDQESDVQKFSHLITFPGFSITLDSMVSDFLPQDHGSTSDLMDREERVATGRRFRRIHELEVQLVEGIWPQITVKSRNEK